MDTKNGKIVLEMPSTEEIAAVDLTKFKKPINLEFSNLKYKPWQNNNKDKNRNAILKNVSGTFYSGRLTAIVGPSGAGKSSLLNVLSGLKTFGVTGSITTNGTVMRKQTFRRKFAYIPQDFALLSKLTVFETLNFASKLKLKSSVPTAVRHKIINNIVEILKLKKCLHTYVDQLSGGEKKRLSIGTELITNPPVMFFDEPTSGLDSSSSIQVISHLKDLVNTGRTIICVIHQPSSRLLSFFDELYVLSEGQCIYSGPMSEMLDTFQQAGFECPNFYNRADFALEIASREREGNLEYLIDKFSPRCADYQLLDKMVDEKTQMLNGGVNDTNKVCHVGGSYWDCTPKEYPISKWSQFNVLIRRNLLTMRRDVFFVQLRLAAHLLIGILLGIVFFNIGNDAAKVQSNVSCLFFFLLFLFFANAMPSVLSFPLETQVFYREYLNNYYSLGVYFTAKLLADFPLLLVGPTSFILGAYYMTGQPDELCRFMMIWTICLLTTIIAQLTGLISGSAFSVQVGNFVVPCSTIPMLIFSGFFIKFNELVECLKPLTYLSYFRYSFEGSVQAIYGFNRTSLDCSQPFCYFRNSEKFLVHMDMGENKYWIDVFSLSIWIVSLVILLYVTLKIRLIRNR